MLGIVGGFLVTPVGPAICVVCLRALVDDAGGAWPLFEREPSNARLVLPNMLELSVDSFGLDDCTMIGSAEVWACEQSGGSVGEDGASEWLRELATVDVLPKPEFGDAVDPSKLECDDHVDCPKPSVLEVEALLKASDGALDSSSSASDDGSVSPMSTSLILKRSRAATRACS